MLCPKYLFLQFSPCHENTEDTKHGLLTSTKPAITVTCVVYDEMNHYHCSMKEHNLARFQIFPYGD